MYSFTVYEAKNLRSGFRVVVGDHVPYVDGPESTVRVYQGLDRNAAVRAAHSGETRPDIRAQIARFFDVESAHTSTHADQTYTPSTMQRPPFYAERVKRDDAGGELYAPVQQVDGEMRESGDTPSYDREAVQRRCDELNPKGG